MKKLISIGLLSFIVLSGAAVAQQPSDQEKGSSMQGMMGQMMQGGEKSGEGGMGDMKGMMKMMGQMSKMMDQCSSMMESAQTKDEKTEQSQPK